MKLADDPRRDYKRLVMEGYDRVAAAYLAARRAEPPEALTRLMALLPEGARVLDLGCGAGVPVMRAVASRFRVVGVDISAAQLALARGNVPDASVVRADMETCAFRDATFDAVVSLYAVFHLPRESHEALLARIRSWLRPGGWLLVSLARHDEAAYTERDFFGVEMYWSNYGIEAYVEMLGRAGFEIVEQGILAGGIEGTPESHPVITARTR